MQIPPTQPSARPPLKSRPRIRSSKIQPIRRRWGPIVPSPLCRYSSRPFCPSSSFTSRTGTAVWLLYQIASTTPCLVHSLLLATPADGCTLQGDIPGLQLLPRRRTPLYFSTLNKGFFAGLSGTSSQVFGVRAAWNADEDALRLLASHQLHSTFEFSLR